MEVLGGDRGAGVVRDFRSISTSLPTQVKLFKNEEPSSWLRRFKDEKWCLKTQTKNDDLSFIGQPIADKASQHA